MPLGATLIVWALVNLAINLLGTTSVALVVFTLYRQSASAGDVDASRVTRFERDSPGARVTLTRRRLVRWAVVGLLAATAIGALAVHTARLEETGQVVAHRGSSKAAPENTIAAFRQAIADGADWIELDVQETADGEVVVFHDSDVMRLAGVSLKIWDATLADLRDIDIGTRFSPAFKDARGMDAQIAVMSLDLDAVRMMKSLRPDWKVGLLMSVSAGNLQNSGADFLAVNAAFTERRFVTSAHRWGTKVYVWTVDDAPTMSAMMGRGVDGLITNKPALAKTVLAQRARMSPAVRLLLELAGILGVTPDIGEL